MKAYFDSIEKEVPEQLQQVFLNRRDTAVITIDMHDGHLSTDPDCPCPSPRGREIIEPLNHFMNEARALGLPIIHVRSTLRKGGTDEKLFPSAWRMVFPVTVGEIPNIAEHAIEGTRWNRMSIDVHDEDYMAVSYTHLDVYKRQVQVYDEHFQALYDAGALLLADERNGLDDRSAVLTDASLYSEATGLSLQADSGQALFG